jgi:lambda family phage minor tail protein L
MPGPTVAEQLQVLHSDDGMVDLLDVDASMLGGSVFHISPQCYANGTNLSYGGQAYSLVPFGIDGFETKSGATDLPQPTLTISNIGAPLLAQVVAYGDFVGAKVTWRITHTSYLDDGANPDATKFTSSGVWTVTQKTLHTNLAIQWQLSSPLDLPGMMFPVRQVLRYPGINAGDGIYFPGVSPFRMEMGQSQ